MGIVDAIVKTAPARVRRLLHPRCAASQIGNAGSPNLLTPDRRQNAAAARRIDVRRHCRRRPQGLDLDFAAKDRIPFAIDDLEFAANTFADSQATGSTIDEHVKLPFRLENTEKSLFFAEN
jgi:hypothetical protein